MFPLLQYYDKHVNMSIIGYFGVVHMIGRCQEQLPSSPTGSRKVVREQEESHSESVSEEALYITYNVPLIGMLYEYHILLEYMTEKRVSNCRNNNSLANMSQ